MFLRIASGSSATSSPWIRRAAGGWKVARQNTDDRALTRTVRAEQANNLALLDRERHATNRYPPPVVLHQAVGYDRAH